MATWSLLVSSGLEFTLTLPGASPVRLCAQDAAVAPVSLDNGHTLMADSREAWNRALAGPGYIYARAINGAARVGQAIVLESSPDNAGNPQYLLSE